MTERHNNFFKSPIWTTLFWVVLFFGLPASADAHAAEQGFVLLLPTALYIAGGTTAVALSLMFVCFMSRDQLHALFRPLTLFAIPRLDRFRLISSLISTVVFFALIAIGIYGPTDPVSNLLPLVIWSAWWVGFVVLQGVFGNLWNWIDPWCGLHRLVAGQDTRVLQLPKWLGCWPAVVLLLAFNGFAMADLAPSDPNRLAQFALGYWLLTFAGMLVFGAQAWRAQVEVFTVFFRFVSDLSPFQISGRLRIGMPGWSATSRPPMTLCGAVFCLVLLGAGSFDGLHETFWWLTKLGINPLEFPGRSAVVWATTFGLIAGNLVLIGIYGGAIWIGVKLANGYVETPVPFLRAFICFSVTLIPIAFGYHFAHFLTSFMVQVQYLLLALADPLGRGSDLLGLGPYTVTTGFLSNQGTVRVIWFSQAGAVVFSHILSVLMAHSVAHTLYRDEAQVIRIQVGLGVLMVAYTVFGLWLLASPRGV